MVCKEVELDNATSYNSNLLSLTGGPIHKFYFHAINIVGPRLLMDFFLFIQGKSSYVFSVPNRDRYCVF